MAPSCCIELSEAEQGQLLEIARQSIISGLNNGAATQLESVKGDGGMAMPLGTFVTISKSGALRGCIGSLESSNPLAQTVANVAYSSAFSDARFPPLDQAELGKIRIEISVLSEPVPIDVSDRADLIARLNPKQDGLLLEDGHYRSVFLPKVWDMIKGSEEFLDHLLAKAGLPADYWSDTIDFKRFNALSFSE